MMYILYDITCDYVKNPRGIDHQRPLFSWKIRGSGQGIRQTAYQIWAADSREALEKGTDLRWDSGRVVSDCCAGIVYEGAAFQSRSMYYWQPRVWIKGKEEAVVGEIQDFETALLYPEDFFADWVGFGPALEGDCLYIRKDFSVRKNLKKAIAYTSGLGLYELYIDGKNTSDAVLRPTFSTVTKSVYYNRSDLTAMLREGDHTIAAVLGNGWSDSLKFWAQIYLTYEDGQEEILSTGWAKGWTGRPGPVRQSLYGGEVTDTEEEIEGWMLPDYDIKAYYERPEGFIQLGVKDAPGGILRSEMLEPIRVTQIRTPTILGSFREGTVLYDTGQNLSGWVHLNYRGSAESRITIRYAESLSEDGTALNQANLRFAKSRNIIRCSGAGGSYRPRFTYHGFRYFEISTEGDAEVSGVTVEVVRNDIPQIGRFSCSDELLNRFQECVLWTEKTNQHGIPTDCPQRDERMGWLNDATSRSMESLFNFDMVRFYKKWMQDIADTVDEKTGAYADTAPYFWGFRPADTASNAYILLGLLLYRLYGDKENLGIHYQNMKGWIKYQISTEKDHQIVPSYYGDWASPQTECGIDTDSGAQSSMTSGAFISMVNLCRSLTWMEEIADILELPGEKQYYQKQFEIFKRYTNEQFYHRENGSYDYGSQTSNASALLFGLVPAGEEKRVLDTLIKDIEDHDYHVTTGNLGTKVLLDTLIHFGRPDLTYRLLTRKTYPGFLPMILSGATTLQERWETDSASTMNSRNHPMHASNGVFFYELLAGINWAEDAVALDKVRICPYIPEELEEVKASYDSIRGLLESGWKKENGNIHYHITIPANMTAELCLTDSQGNVIRKMVDSGTYDYIL